MAKNDIKNLLFDLGGVIMDIERQLCVDAFKRIGVIDSEDMIGLYAQNGSFMALEDGSISAHQFREDIRSHINHPVSDEAIDDALDQFLIGIPNHRLASLRALRDKHKIFMLSNTNPIMFESKIRRCFNGEGKEMEDYFDGIVTSYKALCAKPDEAIFRYAIKHLGIKPEETLFFDDSQKNLDAAALLGFKTALVAPGTEFTDAYNDFMK